MFCEDNLSFLVLSWLQKYSIPVFSQGHFNSFPISSYMLLQLPLISGVNFLNVIIIKTPWIFLPFRLERDGCLT